MVHLSLADLIPTNTPHLRETKEHFIAYKPP
jgi:hypothetical protein